MQTDEALLARIVDGDEQAFEILLGRYETKLYNFVLRMIADRAEAEDVLQEVFFKVYRNAGRFDDRYRASTWIYTIARNSCLDGMKKRARTGAVSIHSPLDADGDERTLEDTLPDKGARPDEDTAQREIVERVREAVNRLPEPQRVVVVLKEYEHLSCEEIAGVVGCPIGTVKSRLYYGMESLKASLSALAKEL